MRGVFIGAGLGLIRRFSWITYAFGALLVYSGIKLSATGRNGASSREKSRASPLSPAFPVTKEYVGGQFFVRGQNGGGLYATPLLVVLLVVETSDILFAVDSIPAVLAITLERLHCLHLERVCHSRAALHVLCPGGNDGPLSLPSLRPGVRC
jgi:tellurite resistance protein TerC